MDRNYENNKIIKKPIETIHFWINETIKNGTWKNYNDLHIDDIDSKITKEDWLRNGLKFLSIADSQLMNQDFLVVLMFTTSSFEVPNNSIVSLDRVSLILDDSPPSIYLFQKKWPPWVETLDEGIYFKIASLENSHTSFLRPIENGFSITIFKQSTPTTPHL